MTHKTLKLFRKLSREIPQIPGAMAYGRTRAQAVSRVEALALQVLAERIEHGEPSPLIEQVFSSACRIFPLGRFELN